MTRDELLASAKPILFHTDMVRAIRFGGKTATRRIVKPQPKSTNDIIYKHTECGEWFISPDDDTIAEAEVKPRYKVGDILYVRETWGRYSACEGIMSELYYKADGNAPDGIKWIASMYMPKAAARIFLRVTGVRAQRVEEITEDEAIDEGFSSRAEFLGRFFEIDKQANLRSWAWVYEFERVYEE